MGNLLRICIVALAVGGCAPDVGPCTRYENQGSSCSCGNGKCESYETTTNCIEDCNKSGPYLINAAQGTVLDTRAKLTWQRMTDGKDYNWQLAKAYCKALPLAGSGWRLPTIEELELLVETGQWPTIDGVAFPNTPTREFWSATAYPGSASSAWTVHFNYGGSNGGDISGTFRVRCVR